MRIVSLVPSVTETLLAWGVEPVACTRFCEQPQLRHVGGTKDPHVGAIVELAPDLVVVDREENRREDAEELVARGVRVVDLHVTSLDDAAKETARLAELVGSDWSPEVVQSRPIGVRAFVPIWRRPWMTFNSSTYGASLLSSIGVGVSHSLSATTYPEVAPDELRELDVDVVLLPTEPYAFAERHVAEVRELVGVDDVRIVDGRDLFWWGVRTDGARQRLAFQLRDLVS
jgi:ABC-type Fe3+-hydroxamate transport system substrate-binding protein